MKTHDSDATIRAAGSQQGASVQKNCMPLWLLEWGSLALLLFVIWFINRWSVRRRREALTPVAQRLGLNFQATDWGARSSGPQLASRHFSQRYQQSFQSFRNSISGELAGFTASFFDHRVAGKSGHTDTVASFTRSIVLPEFALCQRDILTQIGDAVLHRQIDFPTDAAFSGRFHLTGADEDRVRDLFTPDMREFLSGIEPEWRIEASGQSLMMYQAGYVVKPEEYPDFIDETTEMAKNFFSHCHLKKPAF